MTRKVWLFSTGFFLSIFTENAEAAVVSIKDPKNAFNRCLVRATSSTCRLKIRIVVTT